MNVPPENDDGLESWLDGTRPMLPEKTNENERFVCRQALMHHLLRRLNDGTTGDLWPSVRNRITSVEEVLRPPITTRVMRRIRTRVRYRRILFFAAAALLLLTLGVVSFLAFAPKKATEHTVVLAKGETAKVELIGGGTAQFRGPGRLVVQGEPTAHLDLTYGRLDISVTPRMAGDPPVKVSTPHGDLTVIGTRFCVDSQEHGMLVMVEHGKVQYAKTPNAAPISINAGQELWKVVGKDAQVIPSSPTLRLDEGIHPLAAAQHQKGKHVLDQKWSLGAEIYSWKPSDGLGLWRANNPTQMTLRDDGMICTAATTVQIRLQLPPLPSACAITVEWDDEQQEGGATIDFWLSETLPKSNDFTSLIVPPTGTLGKTRFERMKCPEIHLVTFGFYQGERLTDTTSFFQGRQDSINTVYGTLRQLVLTLQYHPRIRLVRINALTAPENITQTKSTD